MDEAKYCTANEKRMIDSLDKAWDVLATITAACLPSHFEASLPHTTGRLFPTESIIDAFYYPPHSASTVLCASHQDPSYKAPVFVTWLKRRSGDCGDLGLEMRGCIGCLEPIVFLPGLSEYALRSSMQDKRFPPVRLEEVPLLTCRISILYQFETCAHTHDWQVGVHGVLISFLDDQGRRYSATYLPEVARDHGMTHDIAIRELVIKAGYAGPCSQELLAAYAEFVPRVSGDKCIVAV